MVKKIKYIVITKVGKDAFHNPFAYKKDGKIFIDNTVKPESIPTKDWVGPVFEKTFRYGQILMLDAKTNCEGDWGRSPSEWDVEYREFTDPIKAMRFSNRIIKKKIVLETL